MAFCPHCGKSVGEQATRCAECGGELEARGKPLRFKGTMMMSPGTAPLIQPPSGGQPRNTAPVAQPAPQPAKPAPSAHAATMPMPAVGPIADAAAAVMAGAGKNNPAALKATMLGTGEGLGNIAQKLAAAAQPQEAAPSPAAATEPIGTAAAPKAAAAPAPQPAPRREAPIQREAPAQEDDSKRFLVGDPMAPTGAPAPSKPQRGSMGRFSDEIPKDRSATWIVVGILGVCVIAALGYVAARLLGLAN